MLTEKRHHMILEYLEHKGSVSVVELVAILNTSESTVRRDLLILDEQGKLKRVHGGAVYKGHSIGQTDVHVQTRKSCNIEAKMAIGRRAAMLIQDGDVIYLDAGTTTAYMINYITAKEVTVVTNAIVHAQKLLEKKVKVYILGGEVKGITEAVVGASAVQDLKKYHFTKGFFGTNGVSVEEGYTTPDPEEAMVKAEAMKRCQKAYVVADCTKYNKISFVTFGDIESATWITDRTKEMHINERIQVIIGD